MTGFDSAVPVVCIMGPTAVGKTDLAVSLVERFPFEIISVDSAMVYRDMDIGTAKPDTATLERAPHRLINIIDPADSYSAAQFRVDALEQINIIRRAGRFPLLVGGNHAVLSGFATGTFGFATSQSGGACSFGERAA